MYKVLKSSYIVIIIVMSIITMISCSEILIEKDISDKTVTLVAPVNNAQFFSTGLTFTWDEVQDATKYTLQIARPNFASPLQIVLDTTITSTSFTQQLPIGNYEWRVNAKNESYSTAFSSRLVSIVSNDDFQSNTVQLISPSNNLITNVAAQNLSWQSVIGATQYQLQVYDNSNTLVLDQSISNTTYNYTFLEGTYQWRVRATNGTENTLYSSRSALIDLTVPNIPTLTSPVNTGTSDTSVTFEWTRTPISGSTERDTLYIYTNSLLTTLYSQNQVVSPYTVTLPAGTYYWKIVGSDTAGNIGSSSSVFSVVVN